MRRLLSLIAVVGLVACASDPTDIEEDDGKSDSFGDDLELGGKRVPRIAPPPHAALNQFALDSVTEFFHAFPVIDFRTKGAAEAGLEHAILNLDRVPVKLGRVAYLRPGLGNITPSPALVFLLARHFETVILLYTNMTDTPSNTAFIRSSSIGGVKIPQAIADEVRIFEIGSPQHNMISASQQSDVLLEQLQILHEQRDVLGFDVLEEPAWMFAHSQGAIDVVLSDHRLRKAGFVGFEDIVTIGGAMQGGRHINTTVGATFAANAFNAAGSQGFESIKSLARQRVAKTFVNHLDLNGPHEIEAALASRVDYTFGAKINLFLFFGNIRPSLRSLALTPDEFGVVCCSDGMIYERSSCMASPGMTFPQVDHTVLFEDPAIMSQMLEFILNARVGQH